MMRLKTVALLSRSRKIGDPGERRLGKRQSLRLFGLTSDLDGNSGRPVRLPMATVRPQHVLAGRTQIEGPDSDNPIPDSTEPQVRKSL
jgi:hypothetical protein